MPNRGDTPWPEIREHLQRATDHRGLDTPLRAFTYALAMQAPDPTELARELLANAPSSPGLEDAPTLLWLLSVAVERLSSRLPPTDSGLAALAERRAELAHRLAQELDEGAFLDPEVADLGDQGELDLRPVVYISPQDALLIDMSLASSEPVMSWMRFEEAQALFGRRERAARSVFARRFGMLLWLIGVLTAAVVDTSLGWAKAEHDLFLPAAVLVVALFGTAATMALDRGQHRGRTVAAGLLTITAALVAGLMTVNQALSHPFLPDVSGFAAAALIGAAAAYAHAILFPEARSTREMQDEPDG